ncbi:MAG: bile acid:sodium symporter, partial [Desulfosporosinus sp.]
DPTIRVGLLILASVPVGVTSIMWTSIVKGDVSLTLVVVTLDTLIVPVWLPTFFQLIVGKTIHIEFWHMMVQLLMMVTLPSLAGMIINDAARGKPTAYAKSVGGLTAKIALFAVIMINTAEVGPAIHWNISLVRMLFVILLMAICGYSPGFLGSYIYRKPQILISNHLFL